MRSAFLLLTACCAVAQPRYDLLLKGGHVIDARNNISAVRDVAIAQGRSRPSRRTFRLPQASKIMDVSSLYVTPGLVDIHVHVFAGSMHRE